MEGQDFTVSADQMIQVGISGNTISAKHLLLLLHSLVTLPDP